MIKCTLTACNGIEQKPRTVAQSHTRSLHVTTLNVGHTEQADAHACTTLSIVTDQVPTAQQVFRALCENALYDALTTDELADIAQTFAIQTYEELAAALIAGRYTYADELSCHREALLGTTQKLEALNAFVQECKAKARAVFTAATTEEEQQ